MDSIWQIRAPRIQGVRQGRNATVHKIANRATDRPRQMHQPPDVTVPISGNSAIPSVLQGLGVEPAAVFSDAGVDLALFNDPENRISIIALGHLVRRCVETTNCAEFGLLVGQLAGTHTVGPVGLLASYVSNVESALHLLCRNLHLVRGGQVLSLEVKGEVAVLQYSIHHPGVEAVGVIEDAALACCFNIMRKLCGPQWLPREVRFSHRRPQNVRPYSRFFGTHLHFDADQSALVFSSHWLRHEREPAAPELLKVLQQQVDSLAARDPGDLREMVRAALRKGVVSGHSSADDIAAQFSMHRRTMARRLLALGTSFEELAAECRYEVSGNMLKNTSLDVSAISTVLGYSDASSFTRAFRRWSGTTPTKWRATLDESASPAMRQARETPVR